MCNLCGATNPKHCTCGVECPACGTIGCSIFRRQIERGVRKLSDGIQRSQDAPGTTEVTNEGGNMDRSKLDAIFEDLSAAFPERIDEWSGGWLNDSHFEAKEIFGDTDIEPLFRFLLNSATSDDTKQKFRVLAAAILDITDSCDLTRSIVSDALLSVRGQEFTVLMGRFDKNTNTLYGSRLFTVRALDRYNAESKVETSPEFLEWKQGFSDVSLAYSEFNTIQVFVGDVTLA